MKFSEMPYTRPDYAAAAKELDSPPACGALPAPRSRWPFTRNMRRCSPT